MRLKIRIVFLLICFVSSLLLWAGLNADEVKYYNPYGAIWSAWSGDYGEGIKPASKNLYWWTVDGGAIEWYETPSISDANRLLRADDSGVSAYRRFYAEDGITTPGPLTAKGGTIDEVNLTKVTGFARQATVISSASQLSSWTGQAASNGVSFFPLEAGKAYEVDLAALAHSQPGYVCSGVSLVMWDATEVNDQRPAVITIIPPTGSTLASDLFSGTTLVYIVPHPGISGATAYGAEASKPQTMQGDYQDANGVLTAGAVASGASVAVLNKIGETVTVQTLNNSGVSAFVREASLKK